MTAQSLFHLGRFPFKPVTTAMSITATQPSKSANRRRATSGRGEQPANLPMDVVDRGERPKPRRRPNWLVATAVSALLAGAAVVAAWLLPIDRWLGAGAEAAAEDQPATASATPEPVFALGRIEPLDQIRQIAPPSGASDTKIDRLLVEEGQDVLEGDTLAVLDNRDVRERARDVAAEKVEQARASLVDTRLQVQTEREELEARLATARLRQRTSQTQAERLRVLLRSDAVTEESVEDAELEAESATREVQQIQAQLNRYRSVQDQATSQELVAQRAVAAAEAELEEAKAKLRQAYVLAPMSGRVLEIHLRPGEAISRGPLLDMANTTQVFVRAEVYESDVRRLEVGQAATVTAAAIDPELHGEVTRIADFVKKQQVVDAAPAANTDARVVDVMVQLDEESAERAADLLGMEVRTEFVP